MIDRIPTQILENGAIRYAEYDGAGNFVQYRYLLPADEPTQEGTPLNKGTLLSDATAALYGLSEQAVPDNVLELLHNSIQQASAPWYFGLEGSSVYQQQYYAPIYFGGGTFFLPGGFNSNFYYSYNGVDFKKIASPFEIIAPVSAYGAGKFITVGQRSNRVAIFENGTMRAASLDREYDVYSVAYGGGKFVFWASYFSSLDSSVTGTYALESSDGITWKSTKVLNDYNAYFASIDYGNSKFVGLNSDGVYYGDGKNMTKATVPYVLTSNHDATVKFLNNQFIVFRKSKDSARMLVSSDGVIWNESPLTTKLDFLDMCYTDGKYIATVKNSIQYYESADLQQWAPAGILQGVVNAADVETYCAYGAEKLVLASKGLCFNTFSKQSDTKNEKPNGEKIGNVLKSVVGAYTGTGTYGVENKNVLSANFNIELAIVTTPDASAYAAFVIGSDRALYYSSPQNGMPKISSMTKAFSWYHTISAIDQLNGLGKIYSYVLIGH